MSPSEIPGMGRPLVPITTILSLTLFRSTWIPSTFGQVRAFAIAAGPSVGASTGPDCGTKYEASGSTKSASAETGAANAATTAVNINQDVHLLVISPSFRKLRFRVCSCSSIRPSNQVNEEGGLDRTGYL